MNATMSNHSKDISEQMDYQGKVLSYGPRAEKRTHEKSRINSSFLFYFYFSVSIFLVGSCSIPGYSGTYPESQVTLELITVFLSWPSDC